ELHKQEDGSYIVKTNEGTEVHCKVVVIAGGVGSFEPRKPAVDNLQDFEGKGVNYMVKNTGIYRDKKIVLAGGGDSALDWTIYLSDIASEVTLIHRGDTFRGAPDSAEKVFELSKQRKINLILKANVSGLQGVDYLNGVIYRDRDEQMHCIETDYFIPLFGLSPKLGPIADWGLNVDKSAVEVNKIGRASCR